MVEQKVGGLFQEVVTRSYYFSNKVYKSSTDFNNSHNEILSL